MPWLFISGLILLGCLSCGSNNAYKTVKVSGSIKYDDGSRIQAQPH